MLPATALHTVSALVSWALSVQLHALPHPQRDAGGADAFIAWAKGAATPLTPLDAPDDLGAPAELSRLAGFTRATRVLALGESVHGTHELTAERARLTEQLIARGRVSAVVMETGLAEARAIDAWINHETDAAPDFARALSYGFGANTETVDALRWMRDYNARVALSRVRFVRRRRFDHRRCDPRASRTDALPARPLTRAPRRRGSAMARSGAAEARGGRLRGHDDVSRLRRDHLRRFARSLTLGGG